MRYVFCFGKPAALFKKTHVDLAPSVMNPKKPMLVDAKGSQTLFWLKNMHFLSLKQIFYPSQIYPIAKKKPLKLVSILRTGSAKQRG